MITFAIVEFNRLIPVIISLDKPTTAIKPDTLQMNTDRYNNDVQISEDSSIDANESLQLKS